MYSDLLSQQQIVAAAIEEYPNSLAALFEVATPIYRPAYSTEQLPTPPKCMVTVTGLGYSERPLSRATKATSMSIQVVVESKYHNDDHLQQYITLTEQLMSVCSGLLGWTENRSSLDEHGMPYQLHNIREQSIYQGIFDAVFEVQRKRKLILTQGA